MVAPHEYEKKLSVCIKIFAYVTINKKKVSTNNLIGIYIVDKLMQRSTTCSNIVSKFEIFDNYVKFLQTLNCSEQLSYHCISWGLRNPFLSSRSFMDQNAYLQLFATPSFDSVSKYCDKFVKFGVSDKILFLQLIIFFKCFG